LDAGLDDSDLDEHSITLQPNQQWKDNQKIKKTKVDTVNKKINFVFRFLV
jgi:hypothetical protein